MAAAERWYRRHAALVRITHWINVVCFTLLLMSGLQIFNAHPALYVGERSDFDHPTIRSGHTCRKTALSEKRRSSDIHSIRRACSASRARTGKFVACLPELDHYPSSRISRLDGAGISSSPGYWC